MNTDIHTYNSLQTDDRKIICDLLAEEIINGLPEAEGKVWHGGPVWFLDGNPIVGYFVRKHHVTLLFWSGQSFDEPGLKPEGTFKAAEKTYVSEDQIDSGEVQQWLKKAESIQWDYKNIVKRKGKLVRLDA